MRLVNLKTNEQIVGKGKVFWPDTRGTEPYLTITVGDYKLFIEGEEELNSLFMAFAPSPNVKYLDI